MKITPDVLRVCIDAYQDFIPLAEIARWAHVSRQGLYKAFKKAGVATNKRKYFTECNQCGKEFEKFRSQLKLTIKNYCCAQCYYESIKNPDYIPNRNGQRIAKEVVLECGYRVIFPEVIHHEDGDNTNNAPENLKVFKNQAEHMRWHRAGGIESGVVPMWEGSPSDNVDIEVAAQRAAKKLNEDFKKYEKPNERSISEEAEALAFNLKNDAVVRSLENDLTPEQLEAANERLKKKRERAKKERPKKLIKTPDDVAEFLGGYSKNRQLGKKK